MIDKRLRLARVNKGLKQTETIVSLVWMDNLLEEVKFQSKRRKYEH